MVKEEDYYRQWAVKDARLQKQGFGPSKLGPGVPAITTTSLLGTQVEDDNGDKTPHGMERSERKRKDPRKRGY